MKLFKLTVICGSILSLSGCFSTPTNPDTTYKPAMSAAYVDLLIEKAKAEERARVMAELAEQNQDDKRFSEIKINQLETKIEGLEQPKQDATEIVETPSEPQNTAVNASADPLLEQWKNIYAQAEEKPETAVVIEETISPADEVVQVNEDVYSAPVYEEVTSEKFVASNQENSYVNKEVSYYTSPSTQSFDTVIRQCVAGQTIPSNYSGALPEVLNSHAQAGDSIRLPTLCKWSRSPEIIKQLQIALSERSFLKPSPPHDLEVIDGVWGVNTLNSLINYQKSKGLAYGQLSIESLVDLGVIQYSDIVNRKGSSKFLKSEVPPDIGQIEKVKPVFVPPKQEVKPEPKISRPSIAPEPAIIPEPQKNIVPEPKSVAIPKVEPKAVPAPKLEVTETPNATDTQISTPNVQFETLETKNCYVNQVIPGDYKGRIPELVKNSKESKVGYVQELPTLCKKDRSKEIITKLQRSLYGSGYLKGGASSINGTWNKNTLNAVRAYQKANGLAYGQLSIEVLESLGVM